MSEQLCWNCKKATGLCPWSAFGKEIKGWEAIPTVIKNSPYKDIKSYEVRTCPLFEGDNVQEKEKRTRMVKVEELQKLFGCSYGTVCRMDTEQVIERAKEKGINLMAIDGKKRKFHKI